MSTRQMRVADIKVNKRDRKDMGYDDGSFDLLVASIEDLGLMNPINVTPDGKLLAGGRRLAAFKKLGRDKIDVRVMHETGS